MKHTGKDLITIYFVMFKIGMLTFGGGWSIISQVQEEFFQKRNWISKEELIDYMSLARTFPGIMVVNYSILTGYSMGSLAGSLAAAFGLVSPAVIVIGLVTLVYDSIRDNVIVIRILGGIRSAVIPIILVSAYKLKANAITRTAHWFLMLAALLVCALTTIPKTVVIIVGAMIGFAVQKLGGKTDAVS